MHASFPRFLLALCGSLIMLAMGTACSSTPRAQPNPWFEADPASPAPEYSLIAGWYNQRIHNLTRLQSPVSVVIDSRRNEGGGSREQLEGLLLVQRPREVALRLDKLGQSVAYLGSNDHAYWWMNLADKPPVVYVGSHLRARRQDADRFGLPVHPTEFIELLGIVPLPEAAPPAQAAPPVAWNRSGDALIITLPSRWGTRRIWLAPQTFDPQRIELRSADGTLHAAADLKRPVPVNIDTSPGRPARLPSQIELSMPQSQTVVYLILSEPTSPRTIRARAFDLVPLMQAYNLGEFIDLDAGKPALNAANP
jgi:hypothetical protein